MSNNARFERAFCILSLREFGFINPVIIDRDFNIIAGHGRILAAKAEGISDVPCRTYELSAAKRTSQWLFTYEL